MSPVIRAPGKAMWLGEYVVLDGAPALVAAVDRHAECRISAHKDSDDMRLIVRTSLSDQAWLLRDQEGRIFESEHKEFALIDTVRQTLQDAEIPLPRRGGTLFFDSTALSQDQKLGLGSSAAIAATAAIALSETNRWSADDALAIVELTQHAHQAFQGGLGSGSDIAAACMGGVLRMQKGCAPRRIFGPAIYPLVIYTGYAANTADFVRAVGAAKDRPGVQAALEAMGLHATRGASAFEAKDTTAFLDAVRAFHRAEVHLSKASSVPVVTQEIADIVDFMETYGGAAKASGAGGGDIVVAFFPTQESQEIAARQASKHADPQGWAVIPLAVEAKGVLDSLHSTPLDPSP